MRFAVTGQTSSRDETEAIANDIYKTGTESRNRFQLFVQALNSLRDNGIIHERDKWIETIDPLVWVYTGDPEGSHVSGSRLRIWAAVEVDANGHPLTLLKIADGYRGNLAAYQNFEVEAFNRLKGGRI